MIKIRKPLCFSEIGRKDNQEDYLFPAVADVDSRVFILCDGMGGHDNGEVASMTAGSTLGEFLTSCSKIDIPTFEAGLEKAYDALDSIDTNSAKKPGTTMVSLCLNEDDYLVAHIGDSRIYHIRPSLYNPETKRGGILYQSSDHSLVNDLLKAGEIDEEEARTFPQKNVITRAMQPHLQKRYKADIYMFDDIQGGDYFFLCSDGILEQLSNDHLCEILASEKLTDEEKIAKIKSVCDGNTRDNYTCWLIPVDKVTLGSKTVTTQAIHADVEEEDKVDPSEGWVSQQPVLPPVKRSVKMVRIIELIFDIIIICVTGWLAFSFLTSSKDESQDKEQVKERVKESKQDNFVAPVKPIVEKKIPNPPASEK